MRTDTSSNAGDEQASQCILNQVRSPRAEEGSRLGVGAGVVAGVIVPRGPRQVSAYHPYNSKVTYPAMMQR